MLGLDRAGKLIEAARALAAAHGIRNASFEVMSLDALTLADKSSETVVSLFAFMREGDLAASARELARVLQDSERPPDAPPAEDPRPVLALALAATKSADHAAQPTSRRSLRSRQRDDARAYDRGCLPQCGRRRAKCAGVVLITAPEPPFGAADGSAP